EIDGNHNQGEIVTMRITRIVVTSAVSALIATTVLALDTYKADPAHSSRSEIDGNHNQGEIVTMRITRIVVTSAVSALIATTVLALDTYKADPAHSSVNFTVDHMVVNTVHGRFRQFEGTITVDPDNGNALKA